MAKVVVTGAAGFIGSHITEALLERGDQVCAIDNLDPRVHGDENPHFTHEMKFIHVDIKSPTSLNEALNEQVDVVFHEAAMVGLGRNAADAESYVSTNAIGTIRLMNAIAKRFNRRPRLVLASSMAIPSSMHEALLSHGPARQPPVSLLSTGPQSVVPKLQLQFS
jgi:dTDP-L-rhamnose 4-epimerase